MVIECIKQSVNVVHTQGVLILTIGLYIFDISQQQFNLSPLRIQLLACTHCQSKMIHLTPISQMSLKDAKWGQITLMLNC